MNESSFFRNSYQSTSNLLNKTQSGALDFVSWCEDWTGVYTKQLFSPATCIYGKLTCNNNRSLWVNWALKKCRLASGKSRYNLPSPFLNSNRSLSIESHPRGLWLVWAYWISRGHSRKTSRLAYSPKLPPNNDKWSDVEFPMNNARLS